MAILDTEVQSRFNLQSYTSLIATKKTVKTPFAHYTRDNYFRIQSPSFLLVTWFVVLFRCLIPRASVSFIETSYEKSFSVACTASILRTKLLHDVL